MEDKIKNYCLWSVNQSITHQWLVAPFIFTKQPIQCVDVLAAGSGAIILSQCSFRSWRQVRQQVARRLRKTSPQIRYICLHDEHSQEIQDGDKFRKVVWTISFSVSEYACHVFGNELGLEICSFFEHEHYRGKHSDVHFHGTHGIFWTIKWIEILYDSGLTNKILMTMCKNLKRLGGTQYCSPNFLMNKLQEVLDGKWNYILEDSIPDIEHQLVIAKRKKRKPLLNFCD